MKKLILIASILIMSSPSYAGFTRCRGGGMTWEISGGSGPTILGSVLVTAKDRSGKYWRGRGDFNSTIRFMELRANVNGKNVTKKSPVQGTVVVDAVVLGFARNGDKAKQGLHLVVAGNI